MSLSTITVPVARAFEVSGVLEHQPAGERAPEAFDLSGWTLEFRLHTTPAAGADVLAGKTLSSADSSGNRVVIVSATAGTWRLVMDANYAATAVNNGYSWKASKAGHTDVYWPETGVRGTFQVKE